MTDQTSAPDKPNGLKPVERVIALRKLREKLELASILTKKSLKTTTDSGDALLQMIKNLLSPDSPTRWMSAFFLLSLTGTVTVLGVMSVKIWKYTHQTPNQLSSEFSNEFKNFKEMQDQRKVDPQELEHNLGKFVLELTVDDSKAPGSRVMNLAEVEIIVLCDNKDTREFFRTHAIQARDQITRALPMIHRDDLMSREGKRRMNIVLLRGLNQWLPKGRVQEIYFSNLLVN